MQELDYRSHSIGKLILKLVIPSIITMLAGSLNIVADGIFIGNCLGSSALAAVNLVMPILMITFGLMDMIASGAYIRIAILLGEKKENEASQVFSASVCMIFLLSIFLSILSFLFAKDLIFFFIKDTELATLAFDYAKVFIPTMPLIAPLFAFDNFLWACGNVNKSTRVNIGISLLNILLNYYFLVYLGLGITYVAIATAISMSIGSILLIMPFVRNKVQLKFTSPKIPLNVIIIIIYNGSSKFFENISASFMVLIVNALMFSVAGADGVAAMSIMLYIDMLFLPVLLGLINAVQPLISYNYGAKNLPRIKEVFKKICIISMSISLVACGTLMLFPHLLVGLFSKESDSQMFEIAVTGLLLYAPSYLFTWFNIVIGVFMSAFEKATASIIIMTLESVVFPILFFFILLEIMGMNGMFLAQSFAAFATFIVALYMWRRERFLKG